MKSHGCVASLLHKNLQQYVTEFILTRFTPLDIKCKKINLMWKTYENIFLGDLEE